MSVTTTYRSRVARIFLLIWVGMLANSVVFRHAHRLADGRIITHAHPYVPVGKSPFQPNPHSQHELIWLDIAGNTPYTSPEVVLLPTALVGDPATVQVRPAAESASRASRHPLFLRRGPPVLFRC